MRLVYRRAELRGITDHHDLAAIGVQMFCRVLFDLLRRDCLHLLDVFADLLQLYAMDGQLADLFGEAGGGFQAVAIATDQGRLARRQFIGGNARAAEPLELAQYQLHHLRR